MKTNREEALTADFEFILSETRKLSVGKCAMSIVTSDAGRPLLVISQKAIEDAQMIVIPIESVDTIFIPAIRQVVNGFESKSRN